MGNKLDNEVILEAREVIAIPDGTAGGGSLQWRTISGATRMAQFSGDGVPYAAGDKNAYWVAQGLVNAAVIGSIAADWSRAIYYRQDAPAAATLMYTTIDGGTNWIAAGL